MKINQTFKVLIVMVVVVSVSFFLNLTKTKEYDQVIEIKKGQSVSKSLSSLSVSTNPMFKLYLKLHNQGKNIKAGYYELKGDYSIISLINTFEAGSDKSYNFTIPEGYTVEQIVNKLVKEGKINKEKFYEALKNIKDFPYPTPNGNFEGYFYPDTYSFPDFFNEDDIIRKILSQFLKNFPIAKYEDKEDFYKKLILASIIEREAVKSDEKPLIASVFYNRIKKGMTLASDATVNYVFGFSKKRIYYKDLKVDSPYNTYKYKGLPPAPIANPDKLSVEAAYNPLETDYLFFVAKGDGYHYFSKTYKEHLRFQNNNKKNKK